MADKEMLLVSSKVKNLIKENDLMCAAETLDALNDCVHACVEKAAERAKANNRKTVQAKDL